MSEADKQYMEEQGVEKALSLALAQIIREQPTNALKRIAQIISPETFFDAEAAKALDAAPPVVDTATSAEEPKAEEAPAQAAA